MTRSNGSKSRRRRSAFCSGFERLEVRSMLDGNVAAGQWSIVGDRVHGRPDDVIAIAPHPSKPTILRATIDGVVVSVRAARTVQSIVVSGGRGNDTITVDTGGRDIPTVLQGGLGNDSITGGAGRDVIFGGPGADSLDGAGGADTIYGGPGKDSLVGAAGDDALFGRQGADTLRGGDGRNVMNGGPGVDVYFGDRTTDTVALGVGERLIGDESTNPLRTVGDLDELKAWYVDAAMAQWAGQLGKPAWQWLAVRTYANGGVRGAPVIATGDHSGTNNQVAGVDEGDVAKTDGSFIYALAGDGIDIVSARPDSGIAVVSHLAIEGTESAVFLHGDRLAVIGWRHVADDGSAAGDAGFAGRMGWWGWNWQSQVVVTVVDVTDRANPAVQETIAVDGWLVSSRAIDGRLLLVTQDSIDVPHPGIVEVEIDEPVVVMPVPADTDAASDVAPVAFDLRIGLPDFVDWGGGSRFVYEDESAYRARLEKAWDAGLALPGYTAESGGTRLDGELVAPSRTYVPLKGHEATMLSVMSVDIGDDLAGPDSVTSVAGVSGEVHASTTSLYVAATTWGNWWDAADSAVNTNVYKFDLADPAIPLVAMGSVPGSVLNQFSLDEHEGFLRIATTNWGRAGSSNGVFVLAEAGGNLTMVGMVNNLAVDERIYSVRFAGDRGFVSTFRQIDPFFVIDLADPAEPRVLGELKVPGFSSYLQQLDDTHVLGVGRDVDPESGRVLGLQISLFDVSDSARPVRAAVYTLPGDGWSTWSAALWDHHAISWFPEQGVLTLPFDASPWWGGGSSLQVFSIDLAAASITKRGEIGHEGTARRGIRIGDHLFSLATGEVKVVRLDSPDEVVARVELTGGDDGPIFWAF
jgi:uncharacterized secreted protein with C-terminal beta-propeller domain